MTLTNEQIEQYRKIVKNAPRGATHFDGERYIMLNPGEDVQWWYYDNSSLPAFWESADSELLSEHSGFQFIDHVRTIIQQHDEIQRLVAALNDIGNMAEGGGLEYYTVCNIINDALEALSNER